MNSDETTQPMGPHVPGQAPRGTERIQSAQRYPGNGHRVQVGPELRPKYSGDPCVPLPRIERPRGAFKPSRTIRWDLAAVFDAWPIMAGCLAIFLGITMLFPALYGRIECSGTQSVVVLPGQGWFAVVDGGAVKGDFMVGDLVTKMQSQQGDNLKAGQTVTIPAACGTSHAIQLPWVKW